MLRGQRSVESQRRTRHLQMMEPTPYRPSVPFRRTPRSAQNHHHSATAAAGSIAATRAPSRDKRRAPMDSDDRGEADREKISSSSSARVRTLGRTAGGYEGGAGRRRRAAGLVTCAPRAAPPTPSACEYWGRRAVHDASIDVCGINGAILAPMRRASHAFNFFNFKQFDRSRESTNGLHPLVKISHHHTMC